MSMNDAPRSVRLHIGFFGCRNAGKSSLVNALTSQQMSVVSDVPGTTTDPVSRSMEILPAGPVVITDTPGYDDEGYLGTRRVSRTKEILRRTDLAVLVVDEPRGLAKADEELLGLFREARIPCILVWNKTDLIPQELRSRTIGDPLIREIHVSAVTGENIPSLRELIGQTARRRQDDGERPLAGDLVHPLDLVILVIPIDESAPKGRLILPQQQVLRDLLDHGAQVLCVRENPHVRIAFKAFYILQNIRLLPLQDLRIFRAEFLSQCDLKIIKFLLLHAEIRRIEGFRASVKHFHRLDPVSWKGSNIPKRGLRSVTRVFGQPEVHRPVDQDPADITKAVLTVDFPGHIEIDSIQCSFRCIYRCVLLKITAVCQSIDASFQDLHVGVKIVALFIPEEAE